MSDAHIRVLQNSKYLYHATYRENLSSILKFGLRNQNTIKNWESSKSLVYLASTAELAESFAETAERLDDEYLIDEII